MKENNSTSNSELRKLKKENNDLRRIVQKISIALKEFENSGEIDSKHLNNLFEGYYKEHTSLLCYDCRKESEMYMVQEALWKKAWEGHSRVEVRQKALQFTGGLFLCFTCLEKRLGRELVIADFPDSPANELLHWGVKKFG